MRRISSLRAASVAALLAAPLALFGTAAQADPYTINLTSVTPLVGGGATYLYTVNLTSTESLVQGDFVSIFDFGTFTGATSAGAVGFGTFTFSNPLTSPTAQSGPGGGLQQPPPVGANDPLVGDLLALYNGPSVTNATFTISANSPFTGRRDDFSYGQTTDNVGPTQGKIATTTPVTVPAFVPGGVIPEPGTMALLATGLLPLAGAVIRRRRSN